MRAEAALVAAVVLFGLVAQGGKAAPQKEACWPQWRGPAASGVAPDANPPLHWGEGTNIAWKTPIPGRGHSTPIVWGDRVILTTAIEIPKAAGAQTPQRAVQFVVMALRRSDGSVLWQQSVCEEVPHAGTHADGSWASGSPVTDGERIYAFFGSYGLHCLDMAGKIKWSKRFGLMKVRNNFGEGASPALCGDLVLANCDQEGPSFLVALDRKTGEERWRVNRDEPTSWSTPIVVESNGTPQIVVSAAKRIRSYEPATGKLLWECAGMTANVIPCPVADTGTVFCISGFRGSALLAIRLAAAAGDITGKPEAIAWERHQGTPYVPSPLLDDGALYFLKGNDGVLSCIDAATGAPRYEGQVLDGINQVYASPVGAADRVYVTGRNGMTLVIKRGPAYEVLARNSLDDSFSASAAMAGRELYLRGHKNLYCIVER
jgi:outer membrane protein assembly factor BamB